jgi:hypothetical protein
MSDGGLAVTAHLEAPTDFGRMIILRRPSS